MFSLLVNTGYIFLLCHLCCLTGVVPHFCPASQMEQHPVEAEQKEELKEEIELLTSDEQIALIIPSEPAKEASTAAQTLTVPLNGTNEPKLGSNLSHNSIIPETETHDAVIIPVTNHSDTGVSFFENSSHPDSPLLLSSNEIKAEPELDDDAKYDMICYDAAGEKRCNLGHSWC